MNDTHQSGPATAMGRHELELRMRAVREHVPGLRALAAERAMRHDHDLDFIDDVRLVVDEVFALLLAHCAATDVLTMRLLVDAQRVRIDASVPTSSPEPVAGTLSLRVLAALADTLDYWVDTDTPDRIFRLTFGRTRPRR